MSDVLMITQPDQIQAFRLLALKGAMTLETKGMTSKFKVPEQIRKMIGSTTMNKVKLLDEYTAYLKLIGVLIA